ncbi:ATP-dependent Clp protease adaptor protein ClpS [Minicystis rosea]|nr:ATP-dependent Clp protease adaptor protein ClpS [Minicystis rosea]
MATPPKRQPDTQGDVAVVTKPKPETQRARRYMVVFHNDHYTTKWFVVMVLTKFFHMSEAAATSFMMIVHEQGTGVAGVYTRDIAETKVAEVMELAKEYEMPLMLTVEPEE